MALLLFSPWTYIIPMSSTHGIAFTGALVVFDMVFLKMATTYDDLLVTQEILEVYGNPSDFK